MRIAVVGSGGREHAILWRLARDPHRHELIAVPGNGGTTELAHSVRPDGSTVDDLARCLAALRPELVIVGPEIPLAAGLADLLRERSISCFGPVRAAAQIEASKVFAKRFMRDHAIPTAPFEVFTDYAAVRAFLEAQPPAAQWVVKADGLAAGKGAFVCDDNDEVLAVARDLLAGGTLGDAGRTIVLERRLFGREVSALFLCDGERFVALPPAQDYKRAFDGDAGPNTGGMGSFCPARHLSPELAMLVAESIVRPVLSGLRDLGAPYRGVLYVGLMLTTDGPQVIEFNCRFGDPETQAILPVIGGDFSALLLQCATGALPASASAAIPATGAAVCVVIAAQNYPAAYPTGIPLSFVSDTDHAFTFHAGTSRKDGALRSSGGRVLNAVGIGPDIAAARRRAYALADELTVPGLRRRADIASSV